MTDSSTPTYTKEQVRTASLQYYQDRNSTSAQLQADVFVEKYALRDNTGAFLELTPADMHRRLAREFARIEAKYPNPLSADEIFEYFEGSYTNPGVIGPQGSPLFGIGNNYQIVSLSNCSVQAPPADTMSSIFDTARDMANLYKRRFGCGLDLSNLRPAGAPVNNAAITSTGAASFADFYSYVTRMVGQSGRRGALMLTMDVRHPDIERFITMKSDLTKVTGANVSVRVSDDFMWAVENDTPFRLQWPINSATPTIVREVRARDLFNLIAETACKTAEPGVLFWDTITRELPLHGYPGFETVGTNPCLTGDTEILTIHGPRCFADLAREGKDVLVYAVDRITNAPVVRWMRNPRKTRENVEVLEIEFDSGLKVRATPDHNFIGFYGQKIKASDLKPGTSVGAFSLNQHRNGHLFVSRGVRGTAHDTHYEYAHRMIAQALGWEDIAGKIIHHKDDNPENNDAASIPLNHKVVAVRPAGRADVYNGTVDDVHTYIVVDPVPVTKSAKFTGILSANCGELPLSAFDSCRLMSMYLAPFVRDEFTDNAYFDWAEFSAAVRVAMRLSDDLVDLELEKLQAMRERADTEDEQRLFDRFIESCVQGRRTGLGTHGLGDALARLTLRYDSPEALKMVDSIYDTLKVAAYDTSVQLAEERGPFPAWDRDIDRNNAFIRNALPQALQMRMDRVGRRNGAILTNAPTGTRSLLSDNCSSGIEPVYALSYERKRKIDPAKENVTPDYVDATGDAWVKYTVFHSNVERFLRKAHVDPRRYLPNLTGSQADSLRGYAFEQFKERLLHLGGLPDYFVTAPEINPMARVRMQAQIQKHIDHSISSTINLPRGTTPATVAAIYLEAYKLGCKGVTVYVDGSREAQVLSTGGQEVEKDTDAACPFCGEFLSQEEQTWHKCPESPARKPAPEKSKTIPYWPYCTTCKKPYEFDKEEPFARCACGVSEWGDPRPAAYVENPGMLLDRLNKAEDQIKALLERNEKCLTRTHRGNETTGQMRKASFRDHEGNERKVYVFIGTNDEGRPVEAFVIDEQGAEDFIPYSSALAKMVSLALKHGVPSEEVERMLIGLKGGAISFSGQVFNSVPDLLGKRLREARETWQRSVSEAKVSVDVAEERDRTVISLIDKSSGAVVQTIEWSPDAVLTPTTGPDAIRRAMYGGAEPPTTALTGATAKPVVSLPAGETCPSCGEAQVIREGGCEKCVNCGWSRCG